ncbi:MAG TPA: hypothetical protein DEA08_20710, partial [Planctomycetes bacterium]|nr:hypothetical protein [Planctomycetota bacterium]
MQGQVGRYQVVGELGRGGMGVVYRALDPSSGREVALKVLPPLADAEERQRFSREAETARAIDHPNVLAVLELGQERGRPYLVTELAPGGSLADRLRRAPLDPEEAARVVAQVARGLAAAHERGALHRDLKPGNVLFAADGRALLADFGLARRVRDETLTATGTVLGTPGYMSPEQAQGERADERSDVYGLGSLLYAALVGQPPFRGRSLLETLTAVVNDPAPAPAGAPSELAAIACRCMAKDPRERYPSASAVAEALAGLGAGSGAKSLSAGAWLAALALATAGLLAWGWSGRATPRSAPTPLAQARATASDAPPAPASSSPAPTPRATQAATPKGESGVTLPEDDRQLDDLGLDDAALRRLQAQVEERLDREGESPRVLVNLGRVLVARRQHTAAAALARKAIRLDPEFGAAYRLLALVLNAQGAYDQALEELTQALAIDPQDWQALRERGGVWFSTQK